MELLTERSLRGLIYTMRDLFAMVEDPLNSLEIQVIKNSRYINEIFILLSKFLYKN